MPVMDGWEFRRRQIRDPAIASVSVIAVTGSLDHAQVTARLGVPCLPKPIQLPDVLAELERACSRGRQG
jgi:CheY-like chemotaxis protein